MIYQKTVKRKLEGKFKKEKVKSEKSCHFVIAIDLSQSFVHTKLKLAIFECWTSDLNPSLESTSGLQRVTTSL